MATIEKEIGIVPIPSQSHYFPWLSRTFRAFSERRESLGLNNPGTVEGIAKEVQRDVLLNSLSFSGLRADLTKAFSISPLFHIQHALSSGSQALPPYTFNAMYGSSKVCSELIWHLKRNRQIDEMKYHVSNTGSGFPSRELG